MVSAWSNPRVFKAVATSVALGGGLTIKYSLLLLIFLLVLASCIASAIYAFSRMRRFQTRAQSLRMQKLEQELREKNEKLHEPALAEDKEEAGAVVGKSFAEL